MSDDPVLDAHRVGERCFELGGCFSPASVRDQMLRAYAFVQRAFDERLIDTAQKSLVVVGAGSTGLTAAIAAAQLGVDTVVLERTSASLFRLGQCMTRDVDPTLYDWPADHWQVGAFPVQGAAMPLHWLAGRANVVALRWQAILAALPPAVQAKLTVVHEARPDFGNPAVPPRPGSNGLTKVAVKHQNGPVTHVQCGALVSCVGWHAEITSIKGSTYKGFAFWQDDPYEQPLLMKTGAQPRVLISGGGDGALQDFIRITTNLGTREFLHNLIATGSIVGDALEKVRQTLKYPEDVAQRAFAWGGEPHHDDPVLQRLERAHEAVLDDLVASPAWTSVRDAVQARLAPAFPEMTFAHSRPFFTQCYALNRFLTLLILRVAGTRVKRLRDARVTNIQGHSTSESCGSPRLCHLRAHQVTLSVGVHHQTSTFDVIVLRFGLDNIRSMFPNIPGRVRHILPYFLE